jgi:MoxR-like ATPase
VEIDILSSQTNNHPLDEISYVASANDLVHCQAIVRQVHVSDPIKAYVVKIAQATREHNALSLGCSPRASLALMRASQSLAAYHGRCYVVPKDVRELVIPVLAHRVALKLRAQAQWQSSAHVLETILESIPVDKETDDQ